MKRSRILSESTISNVPEDILIDIFSRVSIKTIAACRCVSKTWSNLLSSSNTQFTKLHFKRSPVQVIIESRGRFHFLELEGDTDLDNVIKPVPSRFRLSRCKLVVMNSCNGFLCLAPTYPVYFSPVCYGYAAPRPPSYRFSSPVKICNPITGEYLNLPKHKMYDYVDRDVVSGFGFCAKTNQYKVVRLVRREGIFNDKVVEVYTIGTKSWRTIGTAPNCPASSFCTTFFNGKIYWVFNVWFGADFIISFDLESEEFGNVPLPPIFNRRCSYHIKFGVLGEFLCMSYDMNLCTMEENGWTSVSVDRPTSVSIDRSDRSHQAIKYLSGGKILMNYDDRELVSYDPVKEIFEQLDVLQFPSRFKTVAHVPSFMSFNDAMVGDKGAKLHTKMCQVQLKRRN